MSTNTDSGLGFKSLTLENWRQEDTVASLFVFVSPTGMITEPSADDWVAIILEKKLGDFVPITVHKLFEVAKGTLCYGAFFYPLFTIGNDQIFRLFETALRMRCAHAPQKAQRNFKELITWAVGCGVIAADRKEQWDAIRFLRNAASHLEDQWIQPPTSALTHLNLAVEIINGLYAANKPGVSLG